MDSVTTLDHKAMAVNRNIAGRSYWKERLSGLEFRDYFNARNQDAVAAGDEAYKDYTATAPVHLVSKLARIGGTDRARHVVLLSALGVLAYKQALCADVCIFTNLAGGISPVRIKGFGGVTFREFLTALKEALKDDIKYSNYPVGKILQARGLEPGEVSITGLAMEGIPADNPFDGWNSDILFSFGITGPLTLSVKYKIGKYAAGDIQPLPGLYFELLDQLLSNPDEIIADKAQIRNCQKASLPVKSDRPAYAPQMYANASLRRAESREYYPLSTAQQRLYYLSELDKDLLSFNLPNIVRLKGNVDKERLNSAFSRLIQRHESLRTSIRIIENEPVQLVLEQVSFEMEYFSSAEEDADPIIERFIRPFDLSRAPLFRVGLLEVDPEFHFLMVDLHHIISDGTSLGLLIKDFISLYEGTELLPPELDYKDYAVWQQSKAYKRKIATQKEFWIREFSEPFAPLDLPLDLSDPSMAKEEVVIFDLSREESRKLRKIAEKEVVTTSMLVLSIITILLSKISGQDDIVIGMAVAGREQLELENIAGMFPLVLPLRSYPKADLPFRQFLGSLKTTFLETLDNQSYPYEDLAKELHLERNTSRNPWFDVICFYQNFETPELSIPDLQLTPYRGKNMVAGEKLLVIVQEVEERIMIRFIYSTALFKKGSIERIAGYFRRIAEAVIANVSVKICDIGIIGEDEKERLLTASCGKPEIDRAKPFSVLFREQVEKTPARIAVEHNGATLTYQSLYDNSLGLAAHFMSGRVSSGNPVALFLPRGIGMLETILAVFHCGCAYVPIDHEFPRERVREILAENGSKTVVTTREMFPVIDELKPSITTLEHIILIDQPDEKEPSTDYEVYPGTDDLAYIIYTSGTSGKPKGAMIHQLGMINHLNAFIDVMELHEDDVVAQTASCCFDISVWQFLGALVTGGRTYIIDKEKIHEPQLLMQAMQEGNVTIFQTVPSLLGGFLNNLPAGIDRVLPRLRWMVTTGESLTLALAKNWYSRYPGIPLLNVYGPTEASDDITTYVVPCPQEGQTTIPIGRSIPNMRVYILDGSLKLCPIGVKGEICVAGIGVGKGYWRDEEKTQKVFLPNPLVKAEADPDYLTLYKTGDFGYFLEDGNIVCLGRRDDQVKIRGFRIELDEIAGWLLNYEEIREAVVLVKQDEADKQLVAYYAADAPIPATELEMYLADHLPHYMIPAYFVHLRQFPLTINGKLDKRLLPAIDIQTRDEYSAPSNPLEEKLAALWAKIVRSGESKISVNTSFFSLGGHSLNTITLINEVEKAFGVKISLKEFFHRPTIAGMAKHILKSDL